MTPNPATAGRHSRCVFAVLVVLIAAAGLIAGDKPRPNYDLANQFSSTFVRQYVHSTSVRPRWIGKTDRFWYDYRTSSGTHYWLVDAAKRTKTPLFDRDKLAAALSQEVQRPLDAANLSLSSVSLEEPGTLLKFIVERTRFEYDLITGELTNKGKAEASSSRTRPTPSSSRTRESSTRRSSSSSRDHRSFSPDKSAYLFATKHNLYLVKGTEAAEDSGDKDEKSGKEKDAAEKDAAEKDASGKKDGDKKDGDKKRDSKKQDGDEQDKDDAKQDDDEKDGDSDNESEKKEPEKKYEYDEKTAQQLTKDGETDYSFGGDDTDRKSRPRASWAKDSAAFYVTRSDSRGVAELYLVNSLSQPRPTLQKYKYPMPGEEKVRSTELYFCRADSGKLQRVESKWKDESYQNIHWGETSEHLRFVRRDRLYRNVELCELSTVTGECRVLISESVNNANISTQSVRYIRDDKQMIWWSERSGWGHFYLYDRDGTFRNAITSGPWLASRIVEVDEDKGLVYVTGNGREAEDDNIYYPHLYSCFLDGSNLTLMDPGNAYHRSTLSPSQEYVVDNCSRVDMAPRSILRDAKGESLLVLEETDLSRLEQTGWRMPERFTVKATDGVTDLYGNMWKPFDFDPKRSYPIILNVYPGPQQEGVSHTFSSSSSRQQLANVGFIVVQVGHRGGSPRRSKAYGSYGYYNLRDYGLADKKAAIEQLAARCSFIDIKRVGLYGHSGGGFMTAAALMKEPYNDFFKVGVSSSGNHDNNVYGYYWAERYHGLKVVEEEKKTDEKKTDEKKTDEKKTDEKKTDEKKTDEKKSDEKKTDEKKTDEKKTDEKKTDEKKFDEKKSDEKKSDEKKSDEKQTDEKQTDEKKTDEKKTDGKKTDEKQTDKENAKLVMPPSPGDDTPLTEKAKRRRERRARREAAAQQQDDSDKTDNDDKKRRRRNARKSQNDGTQEGSRKRKRERQKQNKQEKSEDDQKQEQKKQTDTSKSQTDEKKERKDTEKRDDNKKDDTEKDDKGEKQKKDDTDKQDETQKKGDAEKTTKLEIRVPTNAELAANLKGHLLLVHGDMDNNVHPAGTMRLVDALIKANKRFDMLIIPGKRHGYGDAQGYFTQRMWEYFAEHLLDAHPTGADINQK